MMILLSPLLLLFATINFEVVQSERVLIFLPIGSKSHKNIFSPLTTALAQAGHDMTVVSPFKPSKEQKNVRELVPAPVKLEAAGDPFAARAGPRMSPLITHAHVIMEWCLEVYRNEEFLNLVRNEKFDLVIFNGFANDCFAGVLHVIGAPFIILTAQAAPSFITMYAGNRLPPSFVPTPLLAYSDTMSFFQRMSNLVTSEAVTWAIYFLFSRRQQQAYRNVLGQDLPSVEEIYGNTSMIFMNSHFTLTHPRPTLPDVIEVGGMHCRPAKKLPKDIEEFVAGSQDGFIYFSLGSIVQGSTMPERLRRTFLNVFSRLKQRVLWKWETENMTDNVPGNVLLKSWLPQQDILGHPNIKLFMTHGGLLSTQEATYHGVPLIGLPLFADQDLNSLQAERAGYALAVEILDLTEETLEIAINRILDEKQFSERAKELSSVFKDQPDTPLERAVFWAGYVMRHKGARHMRSAARQLNFIQYHSLDVLGALCLLLFGALWVIKIILWGICRRVCGPKSIDKIKRQ